MNRSPTIRLSPLDFLARGCVGYSESGPRSENPLDLRILHTSDQNWLVSASYLVC